MQAPTHSPLMFAAGAYAVSWLPTLDLVMRIGASTVALISGVLAAIVYIRTLRKK